jgi:hypothetical protein
MLRLSCLLVCASAVACSRAPADPVGPSWWCRTGKCYPTRADCSLGTTATCVVQSTAFCAHGCVTSEGNAPICAPACYAERSRCTDDPARAASCREDSPPAHPDLFPMYSEPGWWCGTTTIPSGKDIGLCDKGKASCESLLSRAGRVAVTCERPPGPVFCWAQRRRDAEDWIARQTVY